MSWVDPRDCEICGHAKAAHDAAEGCLVQLPGGSIMCPCTTYVGLTRDASAAAKLLGAKGGKASAARLTPAQRKARASAAGKARWAKARANVRCSCGHLGLEHRSDGAHICANHLRCLCQGFLPLSRERW